MKFIDITKKDLDAIKADKRLGSSIYNFTLGTPYVFFYKNELHGIFTPYKKSNGACYFKAAQYKPVAFFLAKKFTNIEAYLKAESGAAGKRIKHLYLYNIKKKNELCISIREAKNIYNITLSAQGQPGKEQSYSVRKTRSLSKAIDLISIFITAYRDRCIPFNEIREPGTLLFDSLFPGVVQLFFTTVKIIHIENRSKVPFEFLFFNNYFIGLKYILCHSYAVTEMHEHLRKRRITVFMSGYAADAAMEDELFSVKKIASYNKSYSFRMTKVSCSVRDFYHAFAGSGILHYIGHGEYSYRKKGLRISKNYLFSENDIKKMLSVPEILILSSCRGVSSVFIREFFSKGGQTLLYTSGKIFSEALDQFFNSFYWNFLYRKVTAGEAFKSAKFVLFKSNSNWGKFRLCGNSNIQS
ncbi:hypothetical protein ACFL6D_00445 [Spirochaetota bacterium]